MQTVPGGICLENTLFTWF